MLKALILGLAISCLLLGIECLAVEQIKLAQGESRVVVIPKIFGWLLIGLGSSTTLYTLINRSSLPTSIDADLDSSTAIDTDSASDSPHQWDTTDYDLTEHYHNDEDDEGYDTYDEEEDYFETVEEDETDPQFDLENFNQQFDIDELLEE